MTGKEGFIISYLGLLLLLLLLPLSYVAICKAAISNLHTLADHVSSDLSCPKLHPEDLFPQLQYNRNERCFLHDDDDDDVSVKWDRATSQVAEVSLYPHFCVLLFPLVFLSISLFETISPTPAVLLLLLG